MDKQAPVGWKLWYNFVLRRHIEGAKAPEIAKETGKSLRAVEGVLASSEFSDRYDEMWSTFVIPPLEVIKHYKHDLVQAKIELALDNTTNLSVKNAAIDWLLEKFPEFRRGPDSQVIIQQYIPNKDEIELSRETVAELRQIVEMNLKSRQSEEDFTNGRIDFGK